MVDRHGQRKAFVVILVRVVDLKQNQASFLLHLTVWSCLQFAQMSVSRDMVIFVPTTTTTADGQTDYFTPRSTTSTAWQ